MVREETHTEDGSNDGSDDTGIDTNSSDDTGLTETSDLDADAGLDLLAYVGDTVILDGYGEGAGSLVYTWTQVAGPAVDLEASDTPQPQFKVSDAGNLIFELVVSADDDTSAPDTVTVVVARLDAGTAFESGCGCHSQRIPFEKTRLPADRAGGCSLPKAKRPSLKNTYFSRRNGTGCPGIRSRPARARPPASLFPQGVFMIRSLFVIGGLLVATPALACPGNSDCGICIMKTADETAASAAAVQQADGAQLVLNVAGMKCGVCSDKVTAALKAIDGVNEAAVSHVEGTATVAYDASKITPEQLLAAVTEVGFEVTIPEDSPAEEAPANERGVGPYFQAPASIQPIRSPSSRSKDGAT